jgi:predicted transcriptional regulator
MGKHELSNVSVNIKDQKIKETDKLAETFDGDRSWVINDALDDYLAKQTGILVAIHDSIAEADANPEGGKPHSAVAAEARRLLKEKLGR